MSEQCEHPVHGHWPERSDEELLAAYRRADTVPGGVGFTPNEIMRLLVLIPIAPGDKVAVTETRTWLADVEYVFPDGGLSLSNVTWQPRSRDSGRVVFGVGDGRAVTKAGSHVTVVRNVTGIPSRDSHVTDERHVTGMPSRDSHVTPENEGHVTPPLRDS